MASDLTFLRLSTQFENVGDALINRELIRLILDHSDLVMDVSAAPASFIDEVLAGVDRQRVTVLRGTAFASIVARVVRARIAGRRCFYFFLPGGITGEKSRGQALSYRLVTAAIRSLTAAGLKAMHVGASYGLLGPRNLKLVRARVAVLDTHLVRDRQTAAYLRSHGIRVDGLVPDFSFALYPAAVRPQEGKVTAFSFRFDRLKGAGNAIDRIVSQVIGSGDAVSRYRFVSQVRRDDAPMQALCERMRATTANDMSFAAASTIDECFAVYADVETIYSNRLHALLMAAYGGAIPIACLDPVHDAKVAGLFADVGLGANVVVDGRPADVPAVRPDRAAFNAEGTRLRGVFTSLYDLPA